MSLWSRLRAKTLVYVLIPTALGLVAVAAIAPCAYALGVQNVVRQRGPRLARLRAARLSEGVQKHVEPLEDFAQQRDVQSMEPGGLTEAMAGAANELARFDAGLGSSDQEDVTVWSLPAFPRRRQTDYPLSSQFEEIRGTLQFSPGQSHQAHMVVRNGRVAYHGDPSRAGGELSSWDRVAHTTWGLVNQRSWQDISGLIRRYSSLLLGLLIIVGLSSAALFFSLGRAPRSIHDPAQGAQRVPGEEVDYTIAAQTSDELEALGQRSDEMAKGLRESYHDLERRVADRTQELAALNAIAEVVSSSLDLEQVLADALDKTLELMGVEAGGVYLLFPAQGSSEQQVLTIASHRGMSPDLIAAIDDLKVGEGFSGRVVETGEPLVVPDLAQDSRLTRQVVAESGFHSLAIAPLASKDRMWGSLFVITRTVREFSEQDVGLLTHIAGQIAVAIENANLFQMEQRRAEQFRVISEVGRQITSILDIDELLREIVRLLKESFGYYQVTIGLIESDEVVFRAGVKAGLDDSQFVPPPTKVGSSSITGSVAATGQPFLVPDVTREPRFLFLPDSPETMSELAVPLKTKEGVIGVLNVESDQVNAFDESDVTLLQSLANQAAISIENARLFDAEQRRTEQFRVISEVGGHITSILSVDDLLDEIVRLIRETFGYYLVGISLIEDDRLNVKAGVGPPFEEPDFQPPPITVGGEGITGWVASTGEAALVPDVSQDLRYFPLSRESETRSELCVPLKTKETVIGVLNVESDKRDAFDQSDLTVLQSLANQAAIAIENARLYEDVKSRLAQVIALQETTKALASTLELDRLLKLITEEATALVEADGGILNLVDWEANEDEVVASTGSVAFTHGYRSPLEGSLSGWASLHKQAVVSSQLEEDSRVDLRALTWTTDRLKRQIRSAAVAPLIVNGEVAGTLLVVDKQGGGAEFDQTDLDLLVALANQAAVAIENADLFDAVQRRAEQFRVLSEIGARITSLLDVDELLQETVRLVNEVLGYYLVAIGLVEGDELVVKVGAGPSWSDPEFQPPRITVGEGISGWVAETGEPLLVPDVSRDSRYVFLDHSTETRSELAVPLRAKDQIIGVLDVQSDQLNAFDESDLVLLRSLANLTAIAIEEARLIDAEQRRAEQFRVISEVGARITSILTVEELLHQIVRLVRDSLGYYHTAIGLIEKDELIIKTGVGAHWDDPEYQPSRLKVGGKGITAWVAATGEPLLIPDVRQDERYLALPASTEIRSEVAVPLRTTAGVVGVLDVQSDKLHAFDESDLAVLKLVAHQAAIAIENARLFDSEQRRAEQFRVISEVGRHIASILAVHELLGEIGQLIKETFGYHLVMIGLIEGDEMVFSTGVGPPFDDPNFQPLRLKVGGDGITAWVAATGESLLVPDVSQEPRYLLLPGWGEIKSELAIPLRTKPGIIGVLDVQSDRLDAFDETDLAVLQSLAHQAAIAIENARLYEQAQQAAVLEERSRLARDLHDAVTQTLFSASLVGEVIPTVWESDQQQGRQLLGELRQLTRGALAEMRTLLLELRPAALAESDLDELLRQLCEAASGRSGADIHADIEGDKIKLPPDVHVALYRIAQEALNNVVKHSRATDAQVRLQCVSPPHGVNGEEWSTVELVVTDNGCGFDTSSVAPDRLGLGIIRERAEAIGAALKIESEAGIGTEITVLWRPAD